MKARIRSGEEVLGVFDLREGEYIVGSSTSARLQINSQSVAPEHARLKVSAYGVEVEDMGSGLETQFGGRPLVGVQPLELGSAIRVGEFSVELWDENKHHPAAERYRVGAVVAKGAMGVIRRARETSTGREVAMKQMRPGLDDAVLVARFVQEAKITARLEHPNVVPVHDVSQGTGGARFYTMKMVQGVSLEEILSLLHSRDATAVKAYPLETLLTIFQKVCDAIAFAHSKGVIHRDLKPANIMVGKYGEVLVMDWGLAKLVGDAATEVVGESAETLDSARGSGTLAGTVIGTPHYMSPEQASGDTAWVDERSDVYALGAILYRLLTLHVPVEGESAREVLSNVREGIITPPVKWETPGELPHLPGGKIPASMAAVSVKALSHSPERRYQAVQELQTDIRAYQSGFATGAEGAGAMRQLALLLKRHRGISTVIAASIVLLVGLSIVYTGSLKWERDSAKLARIRADESAAAARAHEVAAKAAQHQAEETSAQLLLANAELERQKAVAIAAGKKAEEALQEKINAQGRTAEAVQKQTVAETTATMATKKAEEESMKATVAEAAAEEARKNTASQRIAKLPAQTDVAASKGDAGTVLVNATYMLEHEKDAELILLRRRQIGVALRQMPRLLFMKDGAQLGRVSADGTHAVYFEGSRGTLLDVTTLRAVGTSLNHGTKGSAEAAEFGSDSRILLSVGTISPGRPNVWMWDAATGTEIPQPPWRIEGNLESFLPYPDHSRILTIHAVPGTKRKDKEFNLWTLDGATPTARLKTPAIDGLVAALVPLGRSTQFLLQSFSTAAEQRDVVQRMNISSTTMTCVNERSPTIAAAAAVSPDGTRAVQLVSRQMRLAEAPPAEANGKSIGPRVLSYLKGAGGPGVPIRELADEPQELLETKSGKPVVGKSPAGGAVAGRSLAGGASTFSPDSQWLLMAEVDHAFLHHALDDDAARLFRLELPGRASYLTFSADSSRAVVATEGGYISFWNTKTGRQACPNLLLRSEAKEVSISQSARFVFVSGEAVSLWDTAPRGTREPIDFKKLSTYAVWVSGDGRRAIAIPPGVTQSGSSPVAPMPPGASLSSLTLHNLDNTQQGEHTVARRTEIPPGGTCWLTHNGRFLLVWGGNEGAKIWDMEKRSPRDIFAADHPRYRPPKYRHFYDGKGVIVVESPKDNKLGLAIEDAAPDKDALTALFFDGTTGKDLPDQQVIPGSISRDGDGHQHVTDLDGKATLAAAASRLRRELPEHARRAIFSDDEKLVAILSTSAAEDATTRPVLSELLFQSDLIGRTAEQLKRDGRPYGLTPLAGRNWRLHVYDVETGVCLIGEVTLPTLTAFRWEGDRCVALSSDGVWTEVDLTPDTRPIDDLRDATSVLTGRAISPATGAVSLVEQPIASLVKTWRRLRDSYPRGWQNGVK